MREPVETAFQAAYTPEEIQDLIQEAGLTGTRLDDSDPDYVYTNPQIAARLLTAMRSWRSLLRSSCRAEKLWAPAFVGGMISPSMTSARAGCRASVACA